MVIKLLVMMAGCIHNCQRECRRFVGRQVLFGSCHLHKVKKVYLA